MESSNNDSNRVDASWLRGGFGLPPPDYDPLALTVMSAMLEHDGEIAADVLYEQMRDSGIKRNRVTACIRNTLLKNEMIYADDGVIFVLEGGTDYVIANVHRLDEAAEEAGRTKKEIAAEAARKRAAETGTPLPNEILQTALAMSQEINRLLEALGESPRDFGYIDGKDEKDLPEVVATLTSEMKRLESQYDNQ